MKLILLTALGLAWSFRITSVKFAGVSGIPAPVTFQAALIGIATFLALVLLWRRRSFPLDRHTFGFCCVTAVFSLALPFLAEAYVTPNVALFLYGVIVTTVPIWTVILATLFTSQSMSGREVAGIILGFGAAVLIVLDGSNFSMGGDLVWILAAFIIPFSYAASTVFIAARWPSGAEPIEIAALQSFIAVSAILVVAPFTGIAGNVIALGPDVWKIAAVVAAETAGLLLYFEVIRRAGAVYVSVGNYIAMAFAAIWGALVFGDGFGLFTAIAVPILVLALYLTRRPSPQ